MNREIKRKKGTWNNVEDWAMAERFLQCLPLGSCLIRDCFCALARLRMQKSAWRKQRKRSSDWFRP